MTRRRAAAAVAAAVAGLLIAGCAGVPERSPVVPASRIEAPRGQLFAASPTRGDTPEGIVKGFIAAGTDFHQNHQVAREYLDGGGPKWQPLASVDVVEEEPCLRLVAIDGVPVTAPAGSATACAPSGRERVDRAEAAARQPRDGQTALVRGTAKVHARIDQFGRFALGTGTYQRNFTLVGRGGQWRITDAKPGLVLTPTALNSTFSALPLYFAERAADDPPVAPGTGTAPSPTNLAEREEPRVGNWLVPDVRWFPTALEPSSTAAIAVRALLAGPSAWLGDAVTSGATPGDVALAPLAGVQLDAAGVARVDLTKAPSRRPLLRAQLLATLREVPGVPPLTDVEITVQQVKLDIAPDPVPALWSPPAVVEAPPGQGRQEDPGTRVSGSPLCLTAKGQIGQIRVTDEAVCTGREDLEALTRRAQDPAIPAGDLSGSLFAVLTRERNAVWAMTTEQKEATAVVRGQQLTAPSVDGTGQAGRGWVWAASKVPGGRLLAGGLEGRRQVAVDVPWLGTGQIVSVRISPEGSRALLVVARGARTEAVVSGVVRAADGTPRRLADARMVLLPDLASATDAVWRDPGQVAVLGVRSGSSDTFVWSVRAGGDAFKLVEAPIPADTRPDGLAVSGSIDVFVRAGVETRVSPPGEWPELGVRAPVMPG